MDYEDSAQFEPEKIGWVIVSLSDRLMREKELSFSLQLQRWFVLVSY